MNSPARTTQALIDELVRSTGEPNAAAAVRKQARALINLHVATFGEPTMPLDMDVLASLRGIGRSDELPVHSPDAELVPDGSGGVTMRINPDRPETRRRFSVAHEISHTFFPHYTTKKWCRTDARYRDRNNPDEHLEMLCDVAAAELLFPDPWFSVDSVGVDSAAGLVELATTYRASRDATARRYAEVSNESLAAVFFTWKLKPTQRSFVGNRDQANFLGIEPDQQILEAKRLRIEYAIPSPSFTSEGHFLPRDKSVANSGLIYQAAASGVAVEGDCYLELGQASGNYRVWALPLWTSEEQLGANGENSAVAILQPLKVTKPKSKQQPTGKSLFEFDDA